MINFKPLYAVCALALCLNATGAIAQNTQTTTGESAESSVEETGITLGLELLETLSAEEADMTAIMEEINREIADAIENADNAGAAFDSMVEAVERMAEFGNPEGTFVGNIEDTIALAREIAIEAREIGDEEVMAQMEVEIANFELMRETVLELYTESFRAIRDIEAQRSRFVLRMRARLVQEAGEIAQRGLAIVTEHRDRIYEVRDAATGSQDDDEVVSE